MNPEYVAKKSKLHAFTPLRILFFWLIIPIFVIIFDMIKLSKETIEFYEDKVIQRSGIISKKEKRAAFTGVLGVSISQSVMGRMFNYGDVRIDIPGTWDINTYGIKAPRDLQNYLETRLVKTNSNAVNTMLG